MNHDLSTLVANRDPVASLSDADLDQVLSGANLERMIAARLDSARHTTSRRRASAWFTFPKVGLAALASAAAVVGLVVVEVGSGSGVAFALAPSTGMFVAHGVYAGQPSSSWTYPVLSSSTYKIAGFPTLPSTASTSAAYQVTGPTNLGTEASRVASALGVSGQPSTDGSGGWYVGTIKGGPSISLYPDNATGLTTISYIGPNGSNPASVCPPAGSTVFSDSAAMTASTDQLVSSLGLTYSLSNISTSVGWALPPVCGTPPVAQVAQLTAQVTTGGLAVDGVYFLVDFNQDGKIINATLPDFTTSASSYARTSQAAAATSLTKYESSMQSWVSKWGGSSTPCVSHGCPPIIYKPGQTSTKGSSSTTVTFTSSRLELGPVALTNGQTWLLPRYLFSGRTTGAKGAAFSDSVLALAPKLLSYSSTSKGLPSGVPAPPVHP